MRNRRGFTLLEILVAATIVAILSVVGISSYASINQLSRNAKRKSDLQQVRSALEMYRVDNGSYPGTNTSFITLSSFDPGDGNGPLVTTYLPSIPMDPKSTSTTPVSYYIAFQGSGPNYYSYCICGKLESDPGSNSCVGVTLPSSKCNYGLKNP